jgi:hypothetical protein
MKRLLLALAVLAATNLRAAEPVTPTTDRSNALAFAAGTSASDLEYRRIFHDSQFAVIVLAGYHSFASKTSDSPIGTFKQSGHSTELGLGLRRNFATGEQFRPFLQLSATSDHFSGNCAGGRFLSTLASGGGEYFVGSRVSLEGSAGVQLGNSSSTCTFSASETQTTHTTTINTIRAALGINFYF